MKKAHLIRKALFSTLLSVGVAATVSLAPATASAQDYYDEGVPDYYVASTEPVYYEGHASYWYHNHWVWRDGGRWRYYHNEPAYYRSWRANYPRGRWGHWR
jgi:hypothetical protein